MKTELSVSLVLCLLLGAKPACWAQQTALEGYVATPAPTSEPAASNRFFFPTNSLRGYTEAGYFPSHNEADLGRCASWSGADGGASAPCAAFGRYFLGGYLELQPFARKLGPLPLQHIFFFFEPRAFFGNNIPQYSYTLSVDPISIERAVGVVVEVRKNLEVRLWQHQNDWLGRYRSYLGPADLGSSGPYGTFAAISTRWYFGGWGRQH
jgi:hypothetical protein